VHVAQFLHPLARRPDVEIVEALLPHVLRPVLEEIGLRRMAVPALLGQDAPRKTKFQSLHHDGRILLLRFADQQMNVFGHDHVANDDEGIALADLLQHSQKQVPTARSAEQGLSTITTASDEVKVSSAVVAMQIVPHGHSIAPPRPRGGDVGHPPTVMKTQGRAIQREATSQKPREVAHPQFVLCDGSTTNSFLSQDRCGPPASPQTFAHLYPYLSS
jgi:hypothetical protein